MNEEKMLKMPRIIDQLDILETKIKKLKTNLEFFSVNELKDDCNKIGELSSPVMNKIYRLQDLVDEMITCLDIS